MSYSKQTWSNGDTITAEKLNHIEDGIEAVDSTAYTKPSGGIPKTDLASAVQTSLGKADSAIAAPSFPSAGNVLKYNGSNWIADSKIETVDNQAGLLLTTSDYVRVLHNDSAYGDGGECLFSVRTGENVDGYTRNNGSVVFPVASIDYPQHQAPSKDYIRKLIKSYVGNDVFVYGTSNTMFDANVTADGNGKYNIDCSTFVSAILYGIFYEKSRYAGNADNKLTEYLPNCMFKRVDTAEKQLWDRLTSYNMAKFFAEKKCLYEFNTTNIRRAVNMLNFGDVLFSASNTDETSMHRYYGIDHVMFVIGTLPEEGRVIVAVAGGTPNYYAVNESTVVKTASLKFDSSTLGTTFKVFARPNYQEILSAQSDNLAANYGFKPWFVPNLTINSTSGGLISSLYTGATPYFYRVPAGGTLTYTGSSTGSDSVALAKTVAEYTEDFTFIRKITLANPVTLRSNTAYVRFTYGHAESTGQPMNYADFDLFDCEVT